MDAFGLSPAAPADIEAIIALERRCFAMPWGRLSIEGELTAKGAGGFVLRRQTAESPPGILAYIFFRIVVDEVHIHRIGVDPDWRRRGLGRRLMAACLDAARRRGAASAYLEVRPSNAEAVGLYRRLGFQTVASRPGYYTDVAEDALILKLTLTAKEEL